MFGYTFLYYSVVTAASAGASVSISGGIFIVMIVIAAFAATVVTSASVAASDTGDSANYTERSEVTAVVTATSVVAGSAV